MDETPLFRGRAYLLMLGTETVVATVTDITTGWIWRRWKKSACANWR